MQDNNTKLKYFKVNELNDDVIMFTTKLPCLNESNIILLIESLGLVKNLYKVIIIDISKISEIDRFSIKYLFKSISKLESEGVTIKLLVSKDKPIIPFSKDDQFYKFNLYLSLKSALKYSIN